MNRQQTKDPAIEWPSNSIEEVSKNFSIELFTLLVKTRFWLLLAGHIVVFSVSFILSYSIRFEFEIPDYYRAEMWQAVGWVVAVKVLFFYVFKSFHGWWKYVSFRDLKALLNSVFVSGLSLATIDYFFFDFQIPRSVLIIDSLLTLMVLGAVRSSWRMLHEEIKPWFFKGQRTNVILIGGSEATWRLAHQLRSLPHLRYNIVGLVSMPGSRSSSMTQLPVLGDIDALGLILSCYRVEEMLVPAGDLTGEHIRKLTAFAQSSRTRLRMIPKIEDVIHCSGKMQLREVEINDLLRRDPVVLDNESISEIVFNQVVMVTGAGGSIGSEICRQVLRFQPKKLILIGRGENRIFQIEQELKGLLDCKTQIVPVIADIGDAQRMRSCFELHAPSIVFHAAAHKHVPLMEANVAEAIKNNVLGTKNLADSALRAGVSKFVLISTDKAVNPTSVMGASKHLAERYVLSLNENSESRFVVVRFGNVLGSNGSVIPVFQEQIRQGGPIKITDPRMKRFFMSIPEASQLVLQAAAQGKGGEIFVLNMGEPLSIVDLAKDLIRLSGLPHDAIEIEYTGIRPGEKLFEELYFDEEHSLPTLHPKIMAAYHREFAASEVEQMMDELTEAVRANAGPEEFIAIMSEAIPEFRHNSPFGTQLPSIALEEST